MHPRIRWRAIRAIGWFQAGDTLTRVNYRDLNTEELGSVYEGLLELHPQLERAGGSWQLSYGGGAGSDRGIGAAGGSGRPVCIGCGRARAGRSVVMLPGVETQGSG
jgi:hypothetical protein